MSSFTNPFVRPAVEYQRDLDVLKHYAQDSALYLHLSTGKPLADCQRFVSTALKPGGQFAFVDPAVEFLQRGDNGDRVKGTTTLNHYIKDSVAKRELIAPTLTTYVHPAQKQSILSLYIKENIKLRSMAKKEMFVARAAKQKALADLKKIEQTGRKLGNNAISGAHVSPSTPLYNKTAHSTLTSVCRSTSGYGNANNEKFLCGNRHYFNHHIVLNSIVSIVRNTNYLKLQALVDKYGIHLPTAKETMKGIVYSTNLYWHSKRHLVTIAALVSQLTPLQRAAFLYTGDLYHLKEYNDTLVRTFITRLGNQIQGVHANPAAVLKTAPEDHVALAHLLCKEETRGIGKDYRSIENTPAFCTLALTVENIANVLMDYRDLIEGLWCTTNMPASMAHFPSSIRRCALTSDTDSTIFTVQDWTLWYHGKITFDPKGTQVADTVVFLAASTITNLLAIMSANYGIPKENLHDIAMKNEFKFDVFVPTQLGKHYFADIAAQEGDVFTEHEIEIKGVGLKSSNAPREIIAKGTAMMKDILTRVREDGVLSIEKYLKEIADTEREIIASIQKGETRFLRSGSIKDAQSYTAEKEGSPYMHHDFWNEVFGPKYGTMAEPPYATLKVSVQLDTPVKLLKWLANLEDRDLANRLSAWSSRTKRNKITTLNLPFACVQARGLPMEVLPIVDYIKIVGDIVKIFYVLLETIGYYSNGDKVRRMISTYY
jgi:hypothetical protein